jgi:hypothetical protein
MTLPLTYLDALIFGYRLIQSLGVDLQSQPTLNFLSPLVARNDAANNRTNVSLTETTAIVTIVADTTLTAAHQTVLIDTNAGNVDADLPAVADVTGRIYRIKCIDATNTARVDPNGAELIEGVATITLILNASVTIQSDGTQWRVI